MTSAYRALPGRGGERSKAVCALVALPLVNLSCAIESLMGMKCRRDTVKLKRRRLNCLLELTRGTRRYIG